MKSKINVLADYTRAEFPREVDLACPEEYLRKKLRAVTRGHKRTEKAEAAEKGDAVVLAVESELPRFNRPMVQVAVGSGMYDRELEEQLVGRTVGGTFVAQVQGQPVTVTVKQVARTVFPEPTDEMAAEYAAAQEGMEAVKTVADYRRWAQEQYRDEKRQEALYGGMDACINYVLTHSDWDFDEEELAGMVEQELDYQREAMKKEECLDFDAMSDGDIRRVYGVESREKLGEMFRQGAEQHLATTLWMASACGLDPAQATQEELNQLNWDFLEEYVSGQLKFINE